MSAPSPTPAPLFNKLHAKQVLILGGSSGIGFAVARGALEAGSNVHISSSSTDKVAAATAQLRGLYPDAAARISGSACDLAHAATLASSLASLFDSVGRPVDHIVFTAGDALKITPLADLTPEHVTAAGAVRFLAPLILAQVAMQDGRMVRSAASSFTLTSGSNNMKPAKNWTLQAAYAAGAEGMMRGLAVDMAPVRVNVVSPGAVHTEIFNSIAEDRLEAVLEGFRKATTVGDVGRPEDVAEAYLYCMRDKFCTGQVIGSDGGRLLV